jgi:hypothetical protein
LVYTVGGIGFWVVSRSYKGVFSLAGVQEKKEERKFQLVSPVKGNFAMINVMHSYLAISGFDFVSGKWR